jgi:hypothetical protein
MNFPTTPIYWRIPAYFDTFIAWPYLKHMMNMSKPVLILTLTLTLLPVLCASPVQSTAQEHQTKYRRLILKDGSYVSTGEFSIQGDRVHYFSTERGEWEDLPYSMVDWEATETFAEVESRRRSEQVDESAREFMEEDARTPLVKPGLQLPSPDGVFLEDFYQGKPELCHLMQNGADLKKNLGRNILRGAINPIAGSKQTIELEGPHAEVQSHILNPVIFVSIDPGDPLQGYTSATAKDHLHIVRCEIKNQKRIVGTVNIAIYGKVTQDAQFVETAVEPVSKYWVKVSPVLPLQPGEYALVEVEEKDAMNQFVWDFGVDPEAEPNVNVLRPSEEKDEPVLIQNTRNKAK